MKIDLSTLFEMIEQEDSNLSKTSAPVKQEKQKETALDLQGLFSLFEQLEPLIREADEDDTFRGGTKVATLQDINIPAPKIVISDRLAKQELKDSKYFAKVMNSLGGEKTPEGIFKRIKSIQQQIKSGQKIPSEQALGFSILLEAFYSLFNSLASIGGVGVGWITEAFVTGMYQGELIQAGEGNAKNIAADVVLPGNMPVSIKARMTDNPGDLGSRKNIANTIAKYGYIYFDIFLKDTEERASKGITKIRYIRLRVDKENINQFDPEYDSYVQGYQQIFQTDGSNISNYISLDDEEEEQPALSESLDELKSTQKSTLDTLQLIIIADQARKGQGGGKIAFKQYSDKFKSIRDEAARCQKVAALNKAVNNPRARNALLAEEPECQVDDLQEQYKKIVRNFKNHFGILNDSTIPFIKEILEDPEGRLKALIKLHFPKESESPNSKRSGHVITTAKIESTGELGKEKFQKVKAIAAEVFPDEYKDYKTVTAKTTARTRVPLTPEEEARKRQLKELGTMDKMPFPSRLETFGGDPIEIELTAEAITQLSAQAGQSINNTLKKLSSMLEIYSQAISGYFLSKENDKNRSANAVKAIRTSKLLNSITEKEIKPPEEEIN